MSRVERPNFESLLRKAKGGDNGSLGRLLESYRHYLKLLARFQISRRLQGKADASDLVQETFLRAHDAFEGFRGTTEGELLQWLRSIMVSRLAKFVRRFCETQRRDVRLERRLDEELDRSSQIAQALLHSHSSPSRKAARREEGVLLADALAQLSEEYREVIVLRHFEELSFSKVAQRMGQSVGRVERLWIHALAALRRAVTERANDAE